VECEDLVPWLRTRVKEGPSDRQLVLGGIYCAEDSTIDPVILAGAYRRMARNQNTTFVQDQAVALHNHRQCKKSPPPPSLTQSLDSSIRVELASGDTIDFDHVVVTAGAWTSLLLDGITSPGLSKLTQTMSKTATTIAVVIIVTGRNEKIMPQLREESTGPDQFPYGTPVLPVGLPMPPTRSHYW
jgi:glycine/D-amino acid oxidase-like deaminating enzyme